MIGDMAADLMRHNDECLEYVENDHDTISCVSNRATATNKVHHTGFLL